MRIHCEAIVAMMKKGSYATDYGNNLPLRSKEWKTASNNREFVSINHTRIDANLIEVVVNF